MFPQGFRSVDPSSSLGRWSACIGHGRCAPSIEQGNVRLAEPPHATLTAACTAAPSGQAGQRQHRRLGVVFAPHDFANAVCVGAQPLNDIRERCAFVAHDVYRDSIIQRQSLALDCDIVQGNTGDPVTRYSHGETSLGYVIRRLRESQRIGLSALWGAVSLARRRDSLSPAEQITNILVFTSFSTLSLRLVLGVRKNVNVFKRISLSTLLLVSVGHFSVFGFGPHRRASRMGMCARRRAGQSWGGGLRVAAVPTLTISRDGIGALLQSRNRGRGAARKSPICLDHLLAGLRAGQHFSEVVT
mgnify:CR=1 FL=1|tara:strand:- start:55 stop:957 length:903 start_codon:yes stop_codon:yes gene_type:complete